ncbi:hypothetical protein A6X21_19560 [Planctopirus hydrillae]|uniref:Uncharacterized protein n=1 Tax=Planctopirus hydrillae TaxID=1841610 RepID=A0A1C3EH35_9PLAN|nr:hypothetical protein A6X21_19560 [Planctopirus hydrillae]
MSVFPLQLQDELIQNRINDLSGNCTEVSVKHFQSQSGEVMTGYWEVTFSEDPPQNSECFH